MSFGILKLNNESKGGKRMFGRKWFLTAALTVLMAGLGVGAAAAAPYVPSGQNIHTGYTKNTDACSSCHAAHTGQGTALLQWTSTYNTCMACHDGTISTIWNVKEGKLTVDAQQVLAPGGKFDTTAPNHGSKHDVDGTVAIYAAPGGKLLGGNDQNGMWSGAFGCESCHSPHGQGGNARLLSADPNGIARVQKVTGKALVTESVYFVSVNARGEKDLMLKGYPYTLDTKFYVDGTEHSGGYVIDNSTGYSRVTLNGYTTGTVTADFVPALQVKFQFANKDTATETSQHISGLNSFCGACHTDYDTTDNPFAAKTPSGYYTMKTRHQVGYKWEGPTSGLKFEKGSFDSQDKNFVTCLTCHVAHGTDNAYWGETLTGLDGGVWDNPANLAELSGTSALKRKPNMGVCETCHEKGDGNIGYSAKIAAAPETYGTTANAQYVGSAKCSSCHGDTHTDWKGTLHSKMAQEGPAYYINKYGSKAAAIAAVGDIYKNIIPAAKDNWDSGSAMTKNVVGGAFNIDDVWYTVGSKWKQRYVHKDGTGKYYFGSKQWYNEKPTTDSTVNRAGATIGEWETYGAGSNWENFCISCHATGVKVDSSGTFQSLTEMGIGCEACHGPGSNHAEKPLLQNIVNPKKLSAKAQNDVCGQCHNRGYSSKYTGTGAAVVTALGLTEQAGTIKREDGPGFKPGDKVEDFFSLYWPNSSDTPMPEEFLAKYGDIRGTSNFATLQTDKNGVSSRYESSHHQQYMGARLSKHYGVLTCTTCHTSHKNYPERRSFFGDADNPAKGTGQLASTLDTMCANCHGTAFQVSTHMPFTANSAGPAKDIRTHRMFLAP